VPAAVVVAVVVEGPWLASTGRDGKFEELPPEIGATNSGALGSWQYKEFSAWALHS